MTTRLTFPASMFSVVCQRCGSTLRKNADSCPNCGADRAAAFGDERKKERAPERLSERLSLFKPAGEPAAESAAAVPSPSESAPVPATLPVRAATSAELGFELGPDPDVVPDSEGWTRRKTVIAGVCAFVLVAGGVAYMQHDSTDERPGALGAAQRVRRDRCEGREAQRIRARRRAAGDAGGSAGGSRREKAPGRRAADVGRRYRARCAQRDGTARPDGGAQPVKSLTPAAAGAARRAASERRTRPA